MCRTVGWLFILCALLAGCVTEQEATERVRAEAIACAAGKKTQTSKVRCAINAENRYLTPRYPDLVYLLDTEALEVARRVDRGELTRKQANERLRLIQARIAREKRRRETSMIWHTPKLPPFHT
jgi:hypothetical protein